MPKNVDITVIYKLQEVIMDTKLSLSGDFLIKSAPVKILIAVSLVFISFSLYEILTPSGVCGQEKEITAVYFPDPCDVSPE